jgi:hypothetical protein
MRTRPRSADGGARSRRRQALRVAVLAVVFMGVPPRPLHAQGAPVAPAASQGAEWLYAWSPLAPLADLPRTVPGSAMAMPRLLTMPAPRVGLFWTAGNPAALVTEQGQGWSSLEAELSSADGDYRRPLDAGSERRTRALAQGWAAAGERSAAAGRLSLDQRTSRSPVHAAVAFPFGSSPLVIMDTAGSAMRHSAARVEGAGSVNLGRASLGAALGMDVQESRTLAAPVPRLIRVAAPAATVGVALAVPGTDRVQVGAHASWQRARQSVGLYSIGGATRVYQLSGYRDAPPMDLAGAFYNRDIQRESRAAGIATAAVVGGTTVVAFGEVASTSESHTSLQVLDPPSDDWSGEGLTYGIAAARAFLRDRLALHGTIRRAALEGTARLDESGDVIVFAAEEDRLEALLDARMRLHPWIFGFRVAGTRDMRVRIDSVAGMTARIESWTSAAAAEVARSVGTNLSLALGLGVASYKPAGSIPDPRPPGSLFLGYIGPELAFYGTDATAYSSTITAAWDTRGSATFFLQAEMGSVSPAGTSGFRLGPAVGASRTGWAVRAGATLKPPG